MLKRHVADLPHLYAPHALQQHIGGLFYSPPIGARQKDAGIYIRLHNSTRIACTDANGIVTQTGPQPLGDDRHHAEIDKNEQKGARNVQASIWGWFQRAHEEVTGVWVGVDKVVDKDLSEVGIIQPPCYLGPADARRFDRIKIGDLDAGHIFQR